MKSLYLLPMAVALLAVACPPLPPDVPEPPSPSDGGAPSCSGDPCDVTCCHYRRLGCDEGEDTPKGRSCEDVCEVADAEGIELSKDPACMSEASSCEAARDCD